MTKDARISRFYSISAGVFCEFRIFSVARKRMPSEKSHEICPVLQNESILQNEVYSRGRYLLQDGSPTEPLDCVELMRISTEPEKPKIPLYSSFLVLPYAGINSPMTF